MSRDPSLHASSLNTSESSPQDAQVVGGHTPTPWDFNAGGNLPILHIYGPDGKHLFHKDRSEEEQHANAAFIVKAVNSHEALVKAIKQAQRVLADLTGGDKSLSSINIYAQAVEAELKARTTLSSLKEGK